MIVGVGAALDLVCVVGVGAVDVVAARSLLLFSLVMVEVALMLVLAWLSCLLSFLAVAFAVLAAPISTQTQTAAATMI